MRPHDLAPVAVFAGRPPWTDTLVPPRQGGTRWTGVGLADLLAEPGPTHRSWLPALYARLLVASSGPVLVADTGPGAQRLERARWLRVAPDADLNRARAGAWPALEVVRAAGLGIGSLAPDLVLVGERDPYDRHPLLARSGVWLFRALRHLGHDELTIYVTNALNDRDAPQGTALAQLAVAFAAYEPRWVALGSVAAEVLTGAEVEHVAVEHPAHARRFAFEAGPQGYASKLEAAGVPKGPWATGQLPRHAIEHVPPLLATLELHETLTPPVRLANQRGAVPADVADRARTAFVLGQAATIAAAAALVDPKWRRKLAKLAGLQGWERERERYLTDRRERTKTASAEAEAKVIAEARSTAWRASLKALARVDAALDDPDVPVYARDVKALNEVALSLSERGDLAGDDERRRLDALSAEEFQVELRKLLAGPVKPTAAATPATPASPEQSA